MSRELDVKNTMALIAGMNIPPAPAILQKVHAELQRDEPQLATIANLIASDVGLSALVLKTINSPFFSLRAPVRSIQHATSMLGLGNTINIVAGLALMRSLDDGRSDEKLWETPLLVAKIAAAIARRFPGISADEAYMIGLFHNAGQILMGQHFDAYPAFQRDHAGASAADTITEEDRVFRTNHAVVGYFLGRTWGLERPVCNVIRDHHDTARRLWEDNPHDPAEKEKLLLAVLKMAEHVERCYSTGGADPEWVAIQDHVLGYAGMSQPDFEELRDNLMDMVSTSLQSG